MHMDILIVINIILNHINYDTYKYVYEYKKQLLKHITDLLNNLNIKSKIGY